MKLICYTMSVETASFNIVRCYGFKVRARQKIDFSENLAYLLLPKQPQL